jgi:hypothetical protein
LDEVPEEISSKSIISIRRNTDITDKVVTYNNNSLLNMENLNKSQDQLLYAVQEIYDNNTQFSIDIRAEVDEKVERVSDAVEKLDIIDASVETAKNAAEVASEQAEIATTSSNEAKDLLDTSIKNITATSEEAIRNICIEAQKIVDTGIDSRATVDLDNITAEAEKFIQYQAKLANVPFCANSGNTGGSQTTISFETWTRPTATGTTTTLIEGNMTITASASSDTAWKAFNNVYASSTSDGWRPMATGQQWWKVVFPYRIRITGLLYRNACSDESSSITGRFYTSDTMDTPIGDDFTSPSNNAGSVTITNIPEEGVLTNTIYLQKTAGNKYGGLGELEIMAEKEVVTTISGNIPELLYIPTTDFVETTHAINLAASDNKQHLSADGLSFSMPSIQTGDGGFNGQDIYIFEEPLNRVISIEYYGKKGTNAQYNSLGIEAYAILEDDSEINMFSIAQGFGTVIAEGVTQFENLPTIKGIRINRVCWRGNTGNWSPSCSASFTVTKEIEVVQGTECHFKVGGNYPKLVATSTEKTFEKSYLQPLTIGESGSRTYETWLYPFQSTINEDGFTVSPSGSYTIWGQDGAYDVGALARTYWTIDFGKETNVKAIDFEGYPYQYHVRNGLPFGGFEGTNDPNGTWTQILPAENVHVKQADVDVTYRYYRFYTYNTNDGWKATLKRLNLKYVKTEYFSDAKYNVFVSETKPSYALAGKIYHQSSQPVNCSIGSLINSNGVITGFNANNYITMPETFLPNGKSWECVAKVRTSDDITTQQCVFSLGWNGSIASKKYGSQWGIRNATLFYQFGNGTNTVTTYDVGSVEPNTDYWFKVEFTGSEYKLYLSTTGIFEEPIHSFASTTNFITYNIRPTMGNACFDGTWSQAWLGNIDLKETYINLDGLVWWQGIIDNSIWLNTTVLPYKAYRYTNKKWIPFNDVPIGSIVVEGGIITSVSTLPYNNVEVNEPSNTRPAVVVETYQNGSSWYRVWSDGWCEQGGVQSNMDSTGTGQRTISLLKPFADTNYSVQVSWTNPATQSPGTVWTGCLRSRSVNSFVINKDNKTYVTEYTWQASGYIK